MNPPPTMVLLLLTMLDLYAKTFNMNLNGTYLSLLLLQLIHFLMLHFMMVTED